MQNSLTLKKYNNQAVEIFRTGNDEAYHSWRAWKLEQYSENQSALITRMTDFLNPDAGKLRQLADQCRKYNFAIYQIDNFRQVTDEDQEKAVRDWLIDFCSRFGLNIAEQHRSQGAGGVVAIQVEHDSIGSGYIPYTTKRLSWHTDGYYNDQDSQICGMVLHCVRNAQSGGINELLDPEIVYIRLRDEDPRYIDALFHNEAMIIPENTDSRSEYRPASVGPVFSLNNEGIRLHMRYTARGRNIEWRDDDVTRSARQLLTEIMANDSLICRHQLEPGQGILSNNVLHNRSGFNDGEDTRNRLMYRLRFFDSVSNPDVDIH